MYAIIAESGRQLKVEAGQQVLIDYREDAEGGDAVTFDRVLLVSGEDGVHIGRPTVDGATVTGEVLEQTKGKKLYIQKLRRRKNSRRRTGHRQKYTKVWISEIAGDGFSVKAPERSEIPVEEPAAEEPPAEDLAAEDLAATEQQPVEPPVEEAVDDAVESAADRAEDAPEAEEKKPQE